MTYLTPQDIADRLSISRTSAVRFMREICKEKRDGRWLVSEKQLQEWLDAHRVKPTPTIWDQIREAPGTGYVYFIRSGDSGPIKIGHSINPDARIWGLQAATHLPLRVVTTIVGDKKLEKTLHRKFRRFRIRGEWFRPVPTLLTFIAAIDNRKLRPIAL